MNLDRAQAVDQALRLAELSVKHGGYDCPDASGITASAKVIYEFVRDGTA